MDKAEYIFEKLAQPRSGELTEADKKSARRRVEAGISAGAGIHRTPEEGAWNRKFNTYMTEYRKEFKKKAE